MVLYGIILVPLAKKLRVADPGLLSPFYTDDAAFDGSEHLSAHLLKLLMNRGPERGYFTKLAKSLFSLDTMGQEETTRREFAAEWLELNFVSRSRYLGVYLGPQEDLTVWVKPKLEA